MYGMLLAPDGGEADLAGSQRVVNREECMMSASEFAARRERMVEALPDGALLILFSGEAAVASRDTTLPYWVQRSFYYLTGLEREGMMLCLRRSGEQRDCIVWTLPKDPDREKWTGVRMTKDAITELSGIGDVRDSDGFENDFPGLAVAVDALYLDLDRLTWNASASRQETFAADVRARYPHLTIHSAGPLLASLRLIKSELEVSHLRKAIDVTWSGIQRMLRQSRPGMYEYQLEAEFTYELNRNGVRQTGYPSIVASGPSAVVLHYDTNQRVTEDGDLVLVDLGAQWEHYSADVSFSFPVNGHYTNRQRQLYELVLHVLREVTALVRPGATWSQLNDAAKGLLAQGLKQAGLMENDEELSRYYYHSIGHFLGLDVHDVGGKEPVFVPGMVVTIEPGIYIAQEGIGIRLEDDVLVTDTGFEVLSACVARDPEAIEALMRTTG